MAARRRSIETRERDARAVELRRRHLNYKQIAAEIGYSEVRLPARPCSAAWPTRQPSPAPKSAQMELDRLDDIARGFQRVFATKHYAISLGSGKVVMDPATGQPLVDDGPVIQAGLALIRVMERRARYLGLDAPTRSRVEVITADVIESEIARLEGELSANDPANTGTA